MKNLLESFAVFLVVALSFLIVFFIVQYNMIEEDTVEEIVLTKPETKESKKAKAASYLDSLEGYGGDVDVKVDATKEKFVNAVAVQSEISEDELDKAVEDKSKSSYMENLEQFSPEVEKSSEPKKEAPVVQESAPVVEEAAPVTHETGTAVQDPEDPEKLPQDEIVDEIGMAIDAALEDL